MSRKRNKRKKQKSWTSGEMSEDEAVVAMSRAVESVYNGEMCPTTTPGKAYGVFMRAGMNGFEELIGQSLLAQRWILVTFVLAELAAFVVGGVASAFVVGWWSALVIPAMYVASRISRELSERSPYVTIPFVAVCVAGWSGAACAWHLGVWHTVFLASIPATWVFQRVLYWRALVMYMDLVLTNEKALIALIAAGTATLLSPELLADMRQQIYEERRRPNPVS
jgi:hypothetical protein